ncbi:MAG: hydroxymethylbilane synthase [bacterium]
MLNDCEIRFEVKTYNTSGDMDKTTPISEIDGSDFFTDFLEKALLNGEIDIAVHSAKDLPDKISDGLVIAAVTRSIDPYDVLISKNNLSLSELPNGAKIATSSIRRKEQLKKYRPDFQILDIRGNIEERLAKLDNSNLDGIVIAAAGLIRLGLENRITQKIPFEILVPHPMQGALAIETRKDNEEMINRVKKLDTRHIEKKR